MVSKITIFEPHFDGAQFGPATLQTDSDEEGAETSPAHADDEAAGVNPAYLVLGSVLLAVFAAIVARAASRRRAEAPSTDADAPEHETADEIPIE